MGNVENDDPVLLGPQGAWSTRHGEDISIAAAQRSDELLNEG